LESFSIHGFRQRPGRLGHIFSNDSGRRADRPHAMRVAITSARR
jgi:hypothetical protein